MEQEQSFKVQINQEVLNREIIINNQEDFLQTGDVLKLCKNKIKEIEEERKQHTDPLEKEKKWWIAKAKEIIDPINSYIDKINKVMSEYHQKKEEIRLAEEKKIEEEKAKYLKDCSDNCQMPDTDKMIIKPEAESTKTTRGNVATTSMVEKWEFEIVSPDEIERAYCSPDDRLIRQAVANGEREIKGVKIFKTFKPTSR